ncbi:MAG: AAA family ATPase [Granulosicoccus sp.]
MYSENEHADWLKTALAMESAVAKAIIGQDEVIRLINISLFARGHVLLEGDVGVGKTTVLRAFARCVGGDFERVEGTIDLMPNDLVYHTYVDAEGQPRIDPGPLLRHGESLTTFFFNEINRARPQVQSLLLRAMAERTVSAFNREFTFPHMTVFADRNKVEKEETFELAAAARDRFMFELNMATPQDPQIRRALLIDTIYHNADTLIEDIDAGLCAGNALNNIAAEIQQFVQTSDAIEKYLLDIWQATQSPKQFGIQIDGVDVDRLVLAGASPRGMSALTKAARVVAWLDGRNHMTPDDVHAVLPAALGHRVFFNPIYELRRSEIAPAFVHQIMDTVASP